ncbi:MAG: cyclic pyranopterin monophosphate synthase MoaC [Candidatus Hydrogenedentota bacterium]|nr:MAG: cyclic pyranopterin monophosphate synthase MoaC [Candidatus Hydrogenedentota bacterium]
MLSHIDQNNQPTMVDVSQKKVTVRTAHARTLIVVPSAVLELLEDGEVQSKKGPVFQTASLAGVMGSKKTSELIPLCHPIALEDCQVNITVNENRQIQIDCLVKTSHKTGVEMEALTGATVAALTVYDMCKAVSHEIEIRETRLIEKTGGKRDYRADGA